MPSPSGAACWPRRLIVGLVFLGAMVCTVIAVGAVGISQAATCKQQLAVCLPQSDQAGCRQLYGKCALDSFPLVLTCIFLLMGTVVAAMLVHIWWSNQPPAQVQKASPLAVAGDATADIADADQGPAAAAAAPAAADLQQQQKAEPLYRKVWDWRALGLFCCFVAASVFYFAVRITKSLDTAQQSWYPKLLLAVELLGYTAMLPYAWILVRHSRVRPPSPTEEAALLGLGPAGALQLPPTTFHVLVPCYTEESENFADEDGSQDIPMVRATLEAVLTAYIPPGCRLTVTLCDDLGRKVEGLVKAQDPAKRQQLAQLGALAKERAALAGQLEGMFPGDAGRLFKRVCRPLVYPGSAAQTNGKSANLNWALRQAIYGAARRPQPDDVIVVFDCDHQPKPQFFTRVLQVMSETQADLVLTPQFFSNTEPGADIFNNDNTQFWKYLLPGYDSWDYIACTGTNFCIRAQALQQAGWFPDNTVTEDYALSLRLKCTKRRKQEQHASKLQLGGPSASSSNPSSNHPGGMPYLPDMYHHQQQQQQNQLGVADVAGAMPVPPNTWHHHQHHHQQQQQVFHNVPSAPPLPDHLRPGSYSNHSNPQQQQQSLAYQPPPHHHQPQQQQQSMGYQPHQPYQQQQQGLPTDLRGSWSAVPGTSNVDGMALAHMSRRQAAPAPGAPSSSQQQQDPALLSDCFLHSRTGEGEDVIGGGQQDQGRQLSADWEGATAADKVYHHHQQQQGMPGQQTAPRAPSGATLVAPPAPQPQPAAAAVPARQSRRFRGRYIYEHLATGLAPVEPRPWFQQRSRWTKGHFEVLFSAKACPLAFWRFQGPLWGRLWAANLYMIGTWSYVTNFISTPVFFLVPFLYLVFGLAPVEFTWELGLAASIYLPLSQMMMGYVRDLRDAKAIWLAGISNAVLSFTYFKAFLNTALTAMGLKPKGGFKPTMGAAAAIAQALDPVVLLLYLVANLATMAVALYMLVTQLLPIHGYSALLQELATGSINLNLGMPFFWAAHNTVAPLLLFAYYATHNRDTPEEPPGRHYQLFVTAMWIYDVTCLAGALGCLWWSIILPSNGPQRSLFMVLADYASGVYANTLAG